MAHAQGAAWVELDVMLTADGVPVVHHDHELERCTNGSGRVAETSLASLRRLDAGGWFHPRFSGERVPTLTEALDLLRAKSMGLNLEFKPAPGSARETVLAVTETLAQHWPVTASLLFSSFTCLALETARDIMPAVPRGYLVDHLPADWRHTVETLECVSVHCDYTLLAPPQVQALRSAGLRVASYTVNEVDAARRLLASGVETIISDYPGRLLSGLGLSSTPPAV
jgi:glycerophosphoryl diester phosphodiesterase